ncbi:MAG TPA: indoleacetamide hydrolase [Mesorhizobium sp.]|jgi:mandelamide amidase|uniref:indoleacetamide hydrolase n=1 Tax=Mesorhizobium sp. TaxID=1871066 RepID=UPI002DDC8FFC|nr:indoleacetamide hydrolase [Mesorhizobium sp.]HEV2507741.1 indoleacetamide hydrolase [Mesorhizobium sp.]
MAELHELGVAAAAKAIHDGEVTAEHLVGTFLDRNAAHVYLNAFVSVDADASLEAARKVDDARRNGAALGPLAGVPLGVKDNIDVVGQECCAGTPGLSGHRPKKDAPVAAALRNAGAIFLGRTGMHELAFGITNNNTFSGAIRNPYDPLMIPGGSSGGAGASCAARLTPGGIGTDTGGSVRVPAALCGIASLRPSAGRWPARRIVPISSTRDTPGPMARCVADLELMDRVVTGVTDMLVARPLGGLRLGVPRGYFWEDLDRETERVCQQALTVLEAAGVTLVEADVADLAALNAAASIIAFYEPGRDIVAYLEESGASARFADIVEKAASPDVQGIMRFISDPATMVPPALYREAMDVHRPRLIKAYRDHFAVHGIDALVFPTTPLPARPIGEDIDVELNGRRVPTFQTFIRNTDPGSGAGLPGINLPIGLTGQGLPVGLALDGLPGGDRALLSIAAAIEALFPALPAPKLDPAVVKYTDDKQ